MHVGRVRAFMAYFIQRFRYLNLYKKEHVWDVIEIFLFMVLCVEYNTVQVYVKAF